MVSDASDYGVGAVISHIFPGGSEKAIAHSSKSLTPTERKYYQIEKEALAIIFAVKKFHFTLITDHKPLISIFGSKKGIPVYTANRLQRWATMLLDYNFSIKYQPGSKTGQADALSKLISSNQKAPEDRVIAAISVEPEVISGFVSTVRAQPVTSEMIKEATAADPTLQKALHFHSTSWPNICTDQKLQPFFQRRSSISETNGILLFAERVVVPVKLQNRVLKQFHYGHQGNNQMKALARVLAKHGQTARGTC